MRYLVLKEFDGVDSDDKAALKKANARLAREIEVRFPEVAVGRFHDGFFAVDLPDDGHAELAGKIAAAFGCTVEPDGTLGIAGGGPQGSAP